MSESQTIEIKLAIPPNNTLTNLLICEGLLYLINLSTSSITVENSTLIIPNKAFSKAYSELDDNRIERIKQLSTVGKNDAPSINLLQEMLNIRHRNKINTYGELLHILKEHAEVLTNLSNKIDLSSSLRGKDVTIGEIKDTKKEGLTLQLFKTERYTGLTSTEYNYTNKQLTTYLSKEAMLIALLGIYSSFITRVSENKKIYYYFLFISPDEINEVIATKTDTRDRFLIKDQLKDFLEQIIRKRFSEELIIAEILVNTRLQELLSNQSVEYVSTLLLKVAQEGNTYKTYEIIPLTVYRRKEREIFKILNNIIHPDGIILKRLQRNENVEYNNLLSAIYGLYRFVVLDDKQGLMVMLRELHNAYVKIRNDEKSRYHSRVYYELIREISNVERLL
ncbi:MAG: hypothetical protein NXY59_09440 [Aigarchaeota archaeon]|nr:hypothetical protein [Candidatus Pelearchaeum maunauluense]